MTRGTTLGQLAVAVMVGMLLAASSVGGLPAVLGLVHDSQSTSAGFAASDDLTVTVENGSASPAAVAMNDAENVTVSFSLESPNLVNVSRISVSVATDNRTGSVAVAGVECDDTCAVVVSGQELLRAASGPGEYDLVVRGWWEYGRQFVAVVPITVERNDPGTTPTSGTETNGTVTDTETNGTVTDTETNGTATDTAMNETTAQTTDSETLTNETTPTSTSNESTPTHTPNETTPPSTPTESTPTSTPAESTPTATPTATATSQSNSTSERLTWPAGVRVSSPGR